ncbi:hypothetical protein L1987_00479 [Smallanthus sonchifolius]|uniref:Uncharacterized protein n=1 Tax=Smallanthus sonchifolius TaxID=185202 RepID=A0ACB9K2C9_9ASTR|nr:hypothetical protein L1987_00479 [Smallanthus sonchifolius]
MADGNQNFVVSRLKSLASMFRLTGCKCNRRPDRSSRVYLTDRHCRFCSHRLIYQCEKGHITCASCCIRLDRKCYNKKAKDMETLIKKTKVECKNQSFGCNKKSHNEKGCAHPLYICPRLPACAFFKSSNKLYDHVKRHHKDRVTSFTYGVPFIVGQKRVILQEENLTGSSSSLTMAKLKKPEEFSVLIALERQH